MLEEGADYYINDDGLFVFTGAYHTKRGYCCQNKCLHCPWSFGKSTESPNGDKQDEND